MKIEDLKVGDVLRREDENGYWTLVVLTKKGNQTWVPRFDGLEMMFRDDGTLFGIYPDKVFDQWYLDYYQERKKLRVLGREPGAEVEDPKLNAGLRVEEQDGEETHRIPVVAGAEAEAEVMNAEEKEDLGW